MSFVRAIALLFIFGPLAAMLVEPFFELLFDKLGWETENFVVPFMTYASEYQNALLVIMGVGAGIWVQYLSQNFVSKLSFFGSRFKNEKLSERDDAPVETIHNSGALSINQRGGITANNVHLGRGHRNLESAEFNKFREYVLNELPRDMNYSVAGLMGDSECIEFANQIRAFMSANGFKISSNGPVQVVMSTPVFNIEINKQSPSEILIVVGPQRH